MPIGVRMEIKIQNPSKRGIARILHSSRKSGIRIRNGAAIILGHSAKPHIQQIYAALERLDNRRSCQRPYAHCLGCRIGIWMILVCHNHRGIRVQILKLCQCGAQVINRLLRFYLGLP